MSLPKIHSIFLYFYIA
uniref:Uncharacterized protein n=1 Tax=Rhizophora mucronata TaxID=61149 RepID=A0A2P2MWQ8_RHIMU